MITISYLALAAQILIFIKDSLRSLMGDDFR